MNKFKSYIKYFYLYKDNKKFRFSLNKYNVKNFTAYYVCYDSKCLARGKIKISFYNDKKYIFDINYQNFILTKKHSIEYDLHSYKRNDYIKTEINRNLVTINKLKNLEYLKLFIKEFCIRNNNLNEETILKLFDEQFPNFEINIKDKEKSKLIRKYMKNNNKEKNIENYNFNDIITLFLYN